MKKASVLMSGSGSNNCAVSVGENLPHLRYGASAGPRCLRATGWVLGVAEPFRKVEVYYETFAGEESLFA